MDTIEVPEYNEKYAAEFAAYYEQLDILEAEEAVAWNAMEARHHEKATTIGINDNEAWGVFQHECAMEKRALNNPDPARRNELIAILIAAIGATNG